MFYEEGSALEMFVNLKDTNNMVILLIVLVMSTSDQN